MQFKQKLSIMFLSNAAILTQERSTRCICNFHRDQRFNTN